MKKVLSIILTLMLVFTLSASIVLADEAATDSAATDSATTDTDATDTDASNSMPADFDETSIVQYLVYDLSGTKEDKDLVTCESFLTGTDGTLSYYADMYASYGQPVEETTYNGNKALLLGKSEFKKEELSDAGIGYVYEKGFLTDKEYYVYVGGSAMNMGMPEGQKIATIVFKLGDRTENFDIIVGNSNTFMVKNNIIDWIKVLILIICIVVLILIGIIVCLSLKGRKKVNEQRSLKDEKYVSEDKIFDELVEEAGIDVDDEVESVDEVSEDEEAEDDSEENE